MATLTLMQETEQVLEMAPVVAITPMAANRLQGLLTEKNIPGYALRVFVAGGGCSGLQYGMAFEKEAREYDHVVEAHGIRLYVDPTSSEYLFGATIDYVDSLMGGGFRIENPNAMSSCGCGHSFKTKDSSQTETDSGHCC